MSNDLIRVANESGFPLQIAIGNLVRATPDLGWTVYCVEHAWASPRKSAPSGFIDLVLEKWNTFLVIECKRVRDATWVFLLPDAKAISRRHARCWVTCEEAKDAMKYYGWYDVTLTPYSPQSAFCAVRGQDTSGRVMLERVASELVAATESFAISHATVRSDVDRIRRYYFNVVVTTARLAICEFSPADIDLSDGTIGNGKVVEVPFVRFRKQLGTEYLGIQHRTSYGEFGLENENTVFVVNAQYFDAFLKDFEVSAEAAAKYSY